MALISFAVVCYSVTLLARLEEGYRYYVGVVVQSRDGNDEY